MVSRVGRDARIVASALSVLGESSPVLGDVIGARRFRAFRMHLVPGGTVRGEDLD